LILFYIIFEKELKFSESEKKNFQFLKTNLLL